MVKPDTKCTSEAQMVAQDLLRELLEAYVHYDRAEDRGGKLGEASLLVQEAAAKAAAIKRCIEILIAANSDDECAEAGREVEDILDTVEHARPLH